MFPSGWSETLNAHRSQRRRATKSPLPEILRQEAGYFTSVCGERELRSALIEKMIPDFDYLPLPAQLAIEVATAHPARTVKPLAP